MYHSHFPNVKSSVHSTQASPRSCRFFCKSFYSWAVSYNLELDPCVKAISACVFQTKAFPDHLDLFLLFPESTWNVLLPSAIVPKMGYLLFMEDSWKLCTIFLKGVGGEIGFIFKSFATWHTWRTIYLKNYTKDTKPKRGNAGKVF